MKFLNFFKRKKKQIIIDDCSVPPRLTFCPKCKFGYAHGHTEEECNAAVESMKNVCSKCNHPNHDYKEGDNNSGMCVQFIAGSSNVMPSICSCGLEEWKVRMQLNVHP